MVINGVQKNRRSECGFLQDDGTHSKPERESIYKRGTYISILIAKYLIARARVHVCECVRACVRVFDYLSVSACMYSVASLFPLGMTQLCLHERACNV